MREVLRVGERVRKGMVLAEGLAAIALEAARGLQEVRQKD